MSENRDELRGKVIVITGASSGFGKGSALAFAEVGAKLVLAARRDELLDELVTECQAKGGQAVAVTTDVSLESEVEALAQSAVTVFGRIDVWINNAGVASVGPFDEIPLADHAQVIRTNLIGTIAGSHCALQQFRRQNSGILINIASAVGKIPAPYYSSYVASKFGVVGLSDALRQEIAERKLPGIHVCTVMPMAMDTPFFEHAGHYGGPEAQPIPPLYTMPRRWSTRSCRWPSGRRRRRSSAGSAR